jgi:diguanylate cyclase (GGDEF)-like protein
VWLVAGVSGQRGQRQSLARDPVLGFLALAMVAICAYQVSGLGTDWARTVVYWLVQAGSDLAAGVLAWAMGRTASTRPVRRFWYGAATAEGCFFASDSLSESFVLTGAGAGGQYHAGQNVFFVAGGVVLLTVMVTYPAHRSTRQERLRLWLDGSTVLIGCGAFAWCLLIGPMLAVADVDHLAESLLGGAIVVLVGFAMVRLVLSGDAPLTRTATAPAVLAVALQAVGDTFEASGFGGGVLTAVRALPALLLVSIPRIQKLQTAQGQPPRQRRRPYSLLPYLAVASTFALLCVQLARTGLDLRMLGGVDIRLLGALAGMALISGLVVVRQLAAFEENAELLARLAHQAAHDPLTGLANRTAFTRALAAALAAPVGVAVVLLDLDGFKAVNDRLGHHAGDLLLAAVADRLRGSVRPGDLPARLGGDEFAVLLPGADEAAARPVVERFLRLLAAPVDIEGQPVRPRASVGAVVGGGPDGARDAEALLRAADAAMYRVKRAGKGSYAMVAAPSEHGAPSERAAAGR